MTTQKNTYNRWLYIMSAVIVLSFVFMGVKLIVHSNQVYDQSYDHFTKITERVLDTTFKKPLTLVTPNYTSIKDGYGQALSFFTLAVGMVLFLLLLPRLQNLAIGPGGVNVTLKDLQQNVESLIKQTNTMQEAAVGNDKRMEKHRTRGVEKVIEMEDQFPDDTQRGKWGGKHENNYKRLSATVRESHRPYFYIVKLTVESTNQRFPLEGVVKFHLHDTFLNPNPVIVVKDGIAVLTLTQVYGAFTVGAEADEGDTVLELDLATLEHAPKAFRER